MLKQILPTVISLSIVAVVLFFRMRKAGKGRPLKPNRLWIRPAILVVVATGVVWLQPPAITPVSLAIVAASALVGVGVGYLLARHQHLTVDAATGAITSKMSPLGMALFVALFAIRYVVRFMAVGTAVPDQAAAHSPQMLLYTDAALLFALGLVAAQAWETWRRAKVLLAETAAKKPESLAG